MRASREELATPDPDKGTTGRGVEAALRLQMHMKTVSFPGVTCWAQYSAAIYGPNGDGTRAVFHQHAFFSRQDDYTKHFNFSSSDGKRRKEAKHRYRVRS